MFNLAMYGDIDMLFESYFLDALFGWISGSFYVFLVHFGSFWLKTYYNEYLIFIDFLVVTPVKTSKNVKLIKSVYFPTFVK
jgi:hypothetical protein